MYDTAKKAREALKSKARRLASGTTEKVSSSDWTPPEPLNADVKTGMRPVSRKRFKAGGKVEGSCGAMRADRKPRKAGGKAESEKAEAKEYANAKVNRDVKAANEEREGIKHVGGLKKGGRAKKEEGGSIESMIANMNKAEAKSALPKRGPEAPRRPTDMTPAVKTPAPKPNPKYQQPGDFATNPRGYSDQRKAGGRTKKMMGGGMFNPAATMGGAQPMAGQPDPRQNIVSPNAMNFIGNPVTPGVSGMKKGGKVARKEGGKVHSDEAQDKALIKKMVKPEARKEKAIGGTLAKSGFGGLLPMAMSAMRDDDDKKARGGKAKKAGGGMLEASKKAMMLAKDPHNQAKIRPQQPQPQPEDKKDDRTARKAGGRTKSKGKTNIAIVINAGEKAKAPGVDMGAPPIVGPDALPIPVPPKGAMPSPMPMPMPAPGGMPPTPPMGGAGGAGAPPLPRKAGGRITKKASSYKDMEAGAASGEGRLQKTDIAAKQPKPGLKRGVIESDNKGYPNKVNGAVGGRTARKVGGRTYRSYKDMDAGAGSGFGRLEKTEIESRKR